MTPELPALNDVRGGAGGRARAEALPPAERSAIAEKAARARWDPAIPEVEYGSDDRPLMLGGVEVACYVLTGGTRVFSQRGMIEALGLTIRGGQLLKLVESVRPFLGPDVVEAIHNPIRFRRPGGGPLVSGYRVELLIDLCTAVLDASEKEAFPKHYHFTVVRAQLLLRAVAKVGIIALVDEVTGYDAERKETLQALLERYLRHELAVWAKRFPDDFYREIYRLKNWEWKGRNVNPPWLVAHITKDVVYARLAPGILPELERRNPREGKRRKGAHHQLLTDDVGVPALTQHLYTVIQFMRASDSWDELMYLLDKALPRKSENMQLSLLEWSAYENQSAALAARENERAAKV